MRTTRIGAWVAPLICAVIVAACEGDSAPPVKPFGELPPLPAADAGAEAIVLGAGFGAPCESATDCASGQCTRHAGARVCSRACSDALPCPPAWSCTGDGTDALCTSDHAERCRPCVDDGACGGLRCVQLRADGLERACAPACEANRDCPTGMSCVIVGDGDGGRACLPDSGVCPCPSDDGGTPATTACAISNEHGTCSGVRTCADGALGPCDAPAPAAERSGDDVDNDCDGDTDEVSCACGDGVCDPLRCSEDLESCPCDCALCGDGACTPCGEGPTTCPDDCCVTAGGPSSCGDGVCLGAVCGEIAALCPEDCDGACGDGACEAPEDALTCPEDCGGAGCGNRTCEPGDGGAEGCPADCAPSCGDCVCDPAAGENPFSCPTDCGACGDGVCSPCDALREDVARCPEDCCVGATERCNGADDDCDGDTDEEGAEGCTTFYVDGDRDGAGAAASARCLCAAEAAHVVVTPGDCDDADPDVRFGAPEACNGADDDCDGDTDEDDAFGCRLRFRDEDRDGLGAPSGARCLCADEAPWTAAAAGDCDDADPAVGAAGDEVCDGGDNDCDGATDEDFGVGEPCQPAPGGVCVAGQLACDGAAGTACVDAAPLPPGTPCGPAACANGRLQLPSTCDGDGACAPLGAVSCGGYACDGEAACRTACDGDEHCDGDYTCDDGRCLPPPDRCDDDAACRDGDPCTEDRCDPQGVCLHPPRSPCGGDHDADGDGVGDAMDLCPEHPDPAQTDVDGDGVGDACDDCVQLAEDEACNGRDDDCDGETDEGFDLGVSCDPGDPCWTGVRACQGGEASCVQDAPQPAGTICGVAACEGAARTPAPTCDGTGRCATSAVTSCAPFACGGSGDCATTCGGHADCAPGHYCFRGTCLAQVADGATCDDDAECASTLCVDGRCCGSPCTATCRRCDDPASPGVCSVIRGATDDDSCAGASACSEGGECRKVEGAPCAGAGSCLSGVCVDGVCCDRACGGACEACDRAGSVGVCSPVLGAEDPDSCAGARACDAAGACLHKRGEACAADTDCVSGACADGVCCDRPCDGTCRSCALPGSVGACVPVTGGEDEDTCASFATCDDDGRCRLRAGLACDRDGACLSGICWRAPDQQAGDGVCCTTGCDEACHSCAVAGAEGTCTQADGLPCTDGDPCTTGSACEGGACVGGDAVVCDDGNPCTADECQTAAGGCVAPPDDGAPCDDGVACTSNDTCSGGSCAGTHDDGVPGCGPGHLCSLALELTGALPIRRRFSLDGTADDLTAGACATLPSSSGDGADDMVFHFEAADDGLYRFAVHHPGGAGPETSLSIWDRCPEGDNGARCLAADDAPGTGDESLTRTMRAGDDVALAVDGATAGASGEFELQVDLVRRVELDCDDDVDNDGDGSTDCVDAADCADALACRVRGDVCGKPLTADADRLAPALGDTTASRDDHAPSSCRADLTRAGGRDVVYLFRPTTGGTFRFTLDPTIGEAFDAVLYAATTCPPSFGGCAGAADGAGTGVEVLKVPLGDGEPLYIYVDGASAADAGGYRLRFERLP